MSGLIFLCGRPKNKKDLLRPFWLPRLSKNRLNCPRRPLPSWKHLARAAEQESRSKCGPVPRRLKRPRATRALMDAHGCCPMVDEAAEAARTNELAVWSSSCRTCSLSHAMATAQILYTPSSLSPSSEMAVLQDS